MEGGDPEGGRSNLSNSALRSMGFRRAGLSMATLAAPGYEFSENFKSLATCKPLVLFDDVALCVFEALEIARTDG